MLKSSIIISSLLALFSVQAHASFCDGIVKQNEAKFGVNLGNTKINNIYHSSECGKTTIIHSFFVSYKDTSQHEEETLQTKKIKTEADLSLSNQNEFFDELLKNSITTCEMDKKYLTQKNDPLLISEYEKLHTLNAYYSLYTNEMLYTTHVGNKDCNGYFVPKKEAHKSINGIRETNKNKPALVE